MSYLVDKSLNYVIIILNCDFDAKSLMAFFSLNEWLGTVTRDRFVTIGNFNNF